MDKNVWLSPRAFRLHAVILIVVPGFMALCVWQITRALGGNSLSWAYVFEWPLFAAYAVYMWWRLVHEGAVPAPSADAPGPVVAGAGPPSSSEGSTEHGAAGSTDGGGDVDDEDPELAAYNAYLSQLADHDRAAGR
jgi:hypothetical protein